MSLRYISVCSGIEAASVAWRPLGWEAVAFAEIEPFPNAVLAHHFPNVPNLGDVSKVDWSKYHGAIDLVVGGTPCQSFSVAGKRKGLDGASGLVRQYFRLLREVRPRWFVWENVPGCLSSGNPKGSDFEFILQQWDDIGYHVAWRILDAQFFGVAQRRRRLFAVGSLGGWKYPVKILFEPEGLPRDSPPRRKEGKENSGGSATGAYTAGSYGGYAPGCGTLRAAGGDLGGGSETLVAGAVSCKWGQGTGGPAGDEGYNLVCQAPPLMLKDREGKPGGGKGILIGEDKSFTLSCGQDQVMFHQAGVRRLTPKECERLQGFSDGWTDIPFKGKPAPDGARYKALGNSMAVPCMAWIGKRIQMVEDGDL